MMIEKTPFIIVDNQKILPIGRLPKDSATAHHKASDEPPYGVVDRVTISAEAREKSKIQDALTEAVPPSLGDRHARAKTAAALLTYSPMKMR